MTEDRSGDEFNSENAELYDTLAHPSRILILKTLSDRPMGFAELKRMTGIESSGNLSFHLNKLGKLVKTDQEGKYCLTDEGREAIRVVEATERLSARARPERQHQGGLKANVKVIGIVLALAIVLGITIIATGSFLSTQTQAANFEFPVPAGTNLMNFSISNPTDAPLTVPSVYVGLWVIVQPNHVIGELLLYLGEGIIIVSVGAFGVWVLLGRYRRSSVSKVPAPSSARTGTAAPVDLA